jgi:hypothetical protein
MNTYQVRVWRNVTEERFVDILAPDPDTAADLAYEYLDDAEPDEWSSLVDDAGTEVQGTIDDEDVVSEELS